MNFVYLFIWKKIIQKAHFKTGDTMWYDVNRYYEMMQKEAEKDIYEYNNRPYLILTD